MHRTIVLAFAILFVHSCDEQESPDQTPKKGQEALHKSSDSLIQHEIGNSVDTTPSKVVVDSSLDSNVIKDGNTHTAEQINNREPTRNSQQPKSSIATRHHDVPLAGNSSILLHRGVNHTHLYYSGYGYGSPSSTFQHRWLRSIGTNSIAIMPYAFQDSAGAISLSLQRPEGTPGHDNVTVLSDEDIVREIASAHLNGLRVMLKPHIWSRDFGDGTAWYGTIDQRSTERHRRWWNSYRDYILRYARLAEENGVEMFCIGTELVTMTRKYPAEWRSLIEEVRKIFSGELTYSAHWDREYRTISFWDALDYIGIGSYFPLKVSDNGTIDELVRAWQPYKRAIGKVSKRYDKPVLFLETGYRPVKGTWREPWLYSGGVHHPPSQEIAITAMFRAFETEPWFHGTYFWKSFTSDSIASLLGENMEFTFKGGKGEAILRREWSHTETNDQ